jgi:hypothetical protein
MNAIRRLAIRLGLIEPRPMTCKLCGFTVPQIGTKDDQAALAIDHMEDAHWAYYFLGDDPRVDGSSEA